MTTDLVGDPPAHTLRADAGAAGNTSRSGAAVDSPDDLSETPGTQPHRVDRGVDEGRGADPASAGVDAARRALISAITSRISEKRLSAAQAALILGLTGPRVTALFNGYVDTFSLDELINLLPALELTIEVVPQPQQ
ncbi:helix-turn-helix domain-containing protein [Mycobacterium europaeum]|uniref:helix-turn-helix domain-containing protein n=1 Tax=Mycobacterium europaeum TaxID=761804 RepID=UPI00130207FE|nr:XRE family transcriptional regulator [Mycobacterium europaeum]